MMKIKIDGNSIRIISKNKQTLRLYTSESGDTDIISFEICKEGFCTGGYLPDIEFSKRDTFLRHIGNRLEHIK